MSIPYSVKPPVGEQRTAEVTGADNDGAAQIVVARELFDIKDQVLCDVADFGTAPAASPTLSPFSPAHRLNQGLRDRCLRKCWTRRPPAGISDISEIREDAEASGRESTFVPYWFSFTLQSMDPAAAFPKRP